MKKYMLFCGQDYYPNGGIGDFDGDFDSFEEAVKSLTCKFDWSHIYDHEAGVQLHLDKFSLVVNKKKFSCYATSSYDSIQGLRYEGFVLDSDIRVSGKTLKEIRQALRGILSKKEF